jgi:ribonucleoside-diphosphate reductase alpha chain
MNSIPFEGFEAHMKNLEIAKHIDDRSHAASMEMATILGEPEWCKGYGLRNTHRIAIAPTKSTANLMGGVSEGINPDPAMVYTTSGAAGEMDRINPVLLKIMKARSVYTKAVVSDLADKQGSVQHVDWLDDHEKAVFKTAFEINQDAVLRMAGTRGKFVDQWQSVNLFFSADEDEAYIAKIHQQAFLDESILALYYIYTQSGVQAAKGECEACQ